MSYFIIVASTLPHVHSAFKVKEVSILNLFEGVLRLFSNSLLMGSKFHCYIIFLFLLHVISYSLWHFKATTFSCLRLSSLQYCYQTQSLCSSVSQGSPFLYTVLLPIRQLPHITERHWSTYRSCRIVQVRPLIENIFDRMISTDT